MTSALTLGHRTATALAPAGQHCTPVGAAAPTPVTFRVAHADAVEVGFWAKHWYTPGDTKEWWNYT